MKITVKITQTFDVNVDEIKKFWQEECESDFMEATNEDIIDYLESWDVDDLEYASLHASTDINTKIIK